MGDPSKLSRDVKGLVADFREELKLRDPWDREIDIQFKRIQRKYKEILFDFPFARQAHSVDQALWTDTSYALITRYRARIDPTRSSPANNKNVVENRKILQKFLAFLAAEGAFWSGIASRLVRVHGLTEANKAMTALGLNVVEFENRESLTRRGTVGTSTTASDDFIPPTHPPPTQEQRSNKLLTVFRALIYLGDLARYREQYGTHPNKSNSDSGSRRSRGGRRGRGGGGEKIQEKPYAKAEAFYTQARLLLPDYGNPFNQLAIVYAYQHDFFGAALNYYRALCVRKPFPTAQDNLIRSLGKCLDVDRELWRTRRTEEGHGAGGAEDTGKGKAKAQSNGKAGVDSDGSKDLESKFKQDVVLLHALWIGKCRLPKLARHTHNVLASFASLLTRRLLPTATIIQVLVLALGALWKVRMFRTDDNPKRENRRADSKGKGRDHEDPEEETPLETRIAAHLLALCTVLLEIATREIQEGVREVRDLEGATLGDERQLAEKLAQRITGTFRRTLPALRIANKWIKGSVRYIQQYPLESASEQSVEPDPTNAPSLPSTMRPNLASFWHAWARFETQLAAAFPLDALPPLTVKLEEDVDMKGFSPLKWGTGGGTGPGNQDERHPGGATEDGADVADVHPNEEQLMRIGDLLVDAKYIANLQECPVSLIGQEFVLDIQRSNQLREGEDASRAYEDWEEGGVYGSDDELGSDRDEEMAGEEDDEPPNHEDDRATVSTRTEDDPVQLAMNAVLTEDEDDDEEILYPQSYNRRHVSVSMSPPLDSAPPPAGPGAVPAWPPPTPSFLSGPSDKAAIQPNPTPVPKRAGTTAEDLLNRVLGGTPTFLNMPSVSTSDTSSLITSATPFGGNTISVHGPTPSFLTQSTQSSIPSPLSAQNPPFNAPGPAFGMKSHQTMSLSPPLPSQVTPFSSRPSSFSSSGSPNPVGQPFPSTSAFPGGRPNDPSTAFFPAHARVSSLTGAASIWTPAPQEVSKSPQLGIPSHTGPTRANSISGSMLPSSMIPPPGGLPAIAQGSEGDVRPWSMRNQGFGEIQPAHGFRTMPRQRTYTTPAEMPHWS